MGGGAEIKKTVQGESWSKGCWETGRVVFRTTWVDHLEWIELTASIKEGLVIAVVRGVIKGELRVEKPVKSIN